MGQISTGVGLISGINIGSIVDQLIAVETRPKTIIQQRSTVLQTQQAAFGGINAKLLALKVRAQELANPSTFRGTNATTSDENILTATSGTGATRGSFSFRIKQLVSAQHTVSKGFADASIEPLAPGGGTLTLEPAAARLTGDTALSDLLGGTGLDFAAGGIVRIVDRQGIAADVDLTGTTTVNDLLERINDSGTGVTASINGAGTAIRLTHSGGGGGSLTVSDQGGTLAAQLGLAGVYAVDSVTGADLAPRYIHADTSLDSLGIARGKFTLTDSAGASATVDLTQGNEHDLGDVISEINSRGLAITARINDAGDGLLLEDTGPGTIPLRVEEDGSTTAANLRILGEAAAPGGNLNGSFKTSITVTANDSLQDVAGKITEAGGGVTAAVLNDGSDDAPFRLSLSGRQSGSVGGFTLDTGGVDLGLSNLNEAHDAIVEFGGDSGGKPLTITSRTNTLRDVLPGVTLDLKAPSDEQVNLSIADDDASTVDAVRGFVDGFNSLIDSIDEHDSYNAQTQERGLLLGNPALSRVKSAVFSAVLGANSELTGQYKALSQVGVTVGSGAKLQLDEAKLQKALSDNPDAVRDLFTFKQTTTVGQGDDAEEVTTARGIGVELSELLNSLTDGERGPIQRQVDGIDDQLELNRKRIESIDGTLARKRARLESQFIAMEQALSQLQNQSGSLQQLQSLAANTRSSGGSIFG